MEVRPRPANTNLREGSYEIGEEAKGRNSHANFQ